LLVVVVGGRAVLASFLEPGFILKIPAADNIFSPPLPDSVLYSAIRAPSTRSALWISHQAAPTSGPGDKLFTNYGIVTNCFAKTG
jgi:hypothetical protein